MSFDPENIKRYEGIDVEGINGSEGWGCGLRTEDEGDVTIVTARDYDALLALYRNVCAQMNQGMHDSNAAGRQQSSLPSFFGSWPGGETDKELLAALDEVRGKNTSAPTSLRDESL